jgi:HSP20 family protein
MAKESAKQGSEMKHYEPSRALSPFEEMERMFESFMPRGWLRPFRWEHPAWREMAQPFEGRVPNFAI